MQADQQLFNYPDAVASSEENFYLDKLELSLDCRKGSSYSIKDIQQISFTLSKLLADLKIESYFSAKPEVILKSHFVVTASQIKSNYTVAILCGNIYKCEQYNFLNIATLLIGKPYQGTKLFNYLWKKLFESILVYYPDFVDAITLKTYNPVSLSLLIKVGMRSNASIYPELKDINCIEANFLNKIVEELGVEKNFEKDRGIVWGGAGGVPPDFYPSLPNITNSRIKNIFSPPLTSNDRILGCIFLLQKLQKVNLLKQFSLTARL